MVITILIIVYSILFIFFITVSYSSYKQQYSKILREIGYILEEYDFVIDFKVKSHSYLKHKMKVDINLDDAKCVINCLLNNDLIDRLECRLEGYKYDIKFGGLISYDLSFNINL